MNNNQEKLVSIVVGVKNGERTIEKFLECCKNQTYKNIEIIVVDNFSADKTLEIAKKYTDKVFTKGPERSAQRNFGIQNSAGEYILVLDADMYLSKNVIKESVEIFENDLEVKSIFIPEETLATGFWGKCKKFERDFYLIGEMSVEAVRFFRKKELDEIGGYDEKMSGGEDWDLSDRFIAKFPKFSRTKSTLLHDDGEIKFNEVIKRKAYYSKLGISNYIKNAPAYRKYPFPFKKSVVKQWYKFFQHPILGISTIFLKFAEGLTIFNFFKGEYRKKH